MWYYSYNPRDIIIFSRGLHTQYGVGWIFGWKWKIQKKELTVYLVIRVRVMQTHHTKHSHTHTSQELSVILPIFSFHSSSVVKSFLLSRKLFFSSPREHDAHKHIAVSFPTLIIYIIWRESYLREMSSVL